MSSMSFLEGIGKEGRLQSDLETDYIASTNASKRAPVACGVIFVVVFSLFSVISSFVPFGFGIKLLQSLSTVNFHCGLVTGIGAASVALPGAIWFFTTILAVAAYSLDWVGKASRFARTSSACAVTLRFGCCTLLLVVVQALLVALAVGSYLFYAFSLTEPPLNKSFTSVPGISGPVHIVRDAEGLTHIEASTKLDAIFGQGFAQAQDRLWELEFQRLAAKGQLAAHVGQAGLKFDKQTRTLNFVNAAKLLCSTMTASQLSLFTAFTDGINYYLKTNTQRPPEFMFMSKRPLYYHEPEPFEPMDVCLAVRLLQWRLSFNVNREIRRFNLFWKTTRAYDEVQELFVNQTNITGTILNAAQMGLSEKDAINARAREARDFAVERQLYDTVMTDLKVKYAPPPIVTAHEVSAADEHVAHAAKTPKHAVKGDGKTWSSISQMLDELDIVSLIRDEASNAWAARAAGSSSACGASDPHLTINMPSVWYYQHMHWGTFDTAGVSMLGIPGVHIGKTSHVSWGITMTLSDLTDLFILVPDPQQRDTHYMHNGASVAYSVREELIEVRGDTTHSLLVRDSLYGPVATEALSLPSELYVAVWAQSLRPDLTSLTAIENFVNENITTVTMMRDMVFGNMRSPGFSIPIADSAGNVGYCITGAHVVRAVGATGTMPTLGNGSFDIVREIPYPELPTLIQLADPTGTLTPDQYPEAKISCANQKIYPDGYKYTLGYDFVYPWRGRRIQELLSQPAAQLSSAQFHMQVQSDTRSNAWMTAFRPWLAESTTSGSPAAQFVSLLRSDGQKWFARLLQWDGVARMGSLEPTFFWWWARELGMTPRDATKATDTPVWQYRVYFKVLESPTTRMSGDCQAALTADSSSSSLAIPPCIRFAAQVFNTLAEQHPVDSFATKWGVDVNRLYGQHLMMHGTPFACMFERWANKDGDHTAIDVADTDLAGNIDVTAASSMRQIYDWSDPTKVHFAFPAGESGNPYSVRYDNLLPLFSADKYIAVVVENGTAAVGALYSSQTLSP